MKSEFQHVVLITLVTITLTLVSCRKYRAKKDIEGVWTFHSGTGHYGVPWLIHKGTWEFNLESGSKGKLIKNWTKEYNGAIIQEDINEIEDFEIVDHGFVINIGIYYGYFLEVSDDTLKIIYHHSETNSEVRTFIRK